MIELIQEYRAQAPWRSWPELLDLLEAETGPLAGARVADLGSALGDQSVLLSERGATVTGVERHPEFLKVARERAPQVRFVLGDLSESLDLPGAPFDGLWLSFSAAYFPAIGSALDRWAQWLRPGGWIAVTEVDDLLGHSPLPADDRAAIESFYGEARRLGAYEFCLRAPLVAALQGRGFSILANREVEDQELAFHGKASAEVEAAWTARFARMPGLRRHIGEAAVARLLGALGSVEHRSQAKVWTLIATKASSVR